MFHHHHGRRHHGERFASRMEQEAIGARHGRGFRPSRGFGRGFMGDDGFPAARRLTSAELQLILLALLAERPAHGYELIRTLDERSGGFYAPSPGMIYPALTYLTEIEQAAVSQDANRKLYTITEAGRAHLDANREQVDGILAALARIGARMGEAREAFAGVADADPAASEELHQARHALKHALSRQRGCAPEEARRIARILDAATAAILGKAG